MQLYVCTYVACWRPRVKLWREDADWLRLVEGRCPRYSHAKVCRLRWIIFACFQVHAHSSWLVQCTSGYPSDPHNMVYATQLTLLYANRCRVPKGSASLLIFKKKKKKKLKMGRKPFDNFGSATLVSFRILWTRADQKVGFKRQKSKVRLG